jgi:release factor glutamine methyltransferase
MNVDGFLTGAASRLRARLGEGIHARLEAQVLAMHALGVSRAWLVAHDREVLSGAQTAALEAILERRLGGEPVAYILGQREFFGRSYLLTPAVLIPRPETEHLVEAALARLPGAARVLDIGAGSGCVALSIKLERPECQVTAVDDSPAALGVARENARRLGGEVEWLESDLFGSLTGRSFDLIASNPPYVAEADIHIGQGDLCFEPRTALASGADGLDAIRRIIEQAPTYLVAGGWLLLEHGCEQGGTVARLLAEAGFTATFLLDDLAGQPRVSGGRKS